MAVYQHQFPTIALPAFAPIPVSMILHTLRMTEEAFVEQIISASHHILQRLAVLQEGVDVALAHIYPIMAAEIANQSSMKLPLTWLQYQVAEQINQKPALQEANGSSKVYSVSPRTLLTWRNNHLLLPAETRRMDLDRAAAILAMSMIDDRKQGFLPPGIDPGEPHKWCYAKTAPDAPILPCPLPLPPKIRPGTLLFMRFPTFEKGWYQIRPPGVPASAPPGSYLPLGAMRFSSMDRQSLARWDERYKNQEASLIFGSISNKANLQHSIERLLYQLAPSLLSASSFPPEVPIVFQPRELYQALTTTLNQGHKY